MQTRQLVGYVLGVSARPMAVYAGDVLTIGRDPQNLVSLPDVLASRNHAVLECAGAGEAFIRDLGSANGTWLNNQRLTPQDRVRLKAGDLVRIGGKLLTFVSGAAESEPRNFGAQVAKMETHAMMAVKVTKSGRVIEQQPPQPPPAHRPNIMDVLSTQKVQPLKPMEEAVALSGNLNDQNVAQIIQFLHSNQKTGELHVHAKKLEGLFAFDEGQIYYAEAGDRKGAPAIYAVARQSAGTFSFRSMDKAPDRAANVKEPMMQIIFECCKRLDETELAGQA